MKIIIAILGPTASGKSDFAIEIAKKINGEILSLDSVSIYKGFNIGASKPSVAAQGEIKHHLIDALDPEEGFSAFHFVEQADETILNIQKNGKIPIVVGGTYFYLRALQNGMYPVPTLMEEHLESVEKNFIEDDSINLKKMHEALEKIDPASAKGIHPNDKYRLVRALALFEATREKPSDHKMAVPKPHQKERIWFKYAFFPPRKTLHEKIELRTEAMLKEGLIQETRDLLATYPRSRALKSIGYEETVRYLKNQITEKQLRIEISNKTKQLAKRQITWLRSDPEIRFIDNRDLDRVLLEVTNLQSCLSEKLMEN